mgnify:CR=1 FL=1
MLGTKYERQAALEELYPIWKPQTLFQMLQGKAEKVSQQVFLLTETETWTYRQILEESQQLASALHTLGVGPGSRVAVCLPNGSAVVLLTFALSCLGAIKVPMNTGLGTVERTYLLNHAQPQVLVEAGTDEPMVRWGPSLNNQLTWGKLIKLVQIDFAPQDHSADLPCDIIYTSGSNGNPKGVILSSDMLLRSAYASCLNRCFEIGRRIYVPLPLFHVYGYVEGLLAAMIVEGSVLIHTNRFSPEQAIHLMEQFQANDLLSVPSIIMDLLQCPALKTANLSSLHAVYCSASTCPAWLWPAIRKHFDVDDVITGYGMTEVAGASVQTSPNDTDTLLIRSVGQCLSGGCAGVSEEGQNLIIYQVVDPQTGYLLPTGTAGELWCRGPIVTKGYFRDPEANACVFTADGWLKTGDIGRIDSNGYLELMGRLSDMYKINGENVAPEFVARIIGECDIVAHVEIVGTHDTKAGEVGAAFLELRPGVEVEAALKVIREHCRHHLAKYQIPKYYYILNSKDWPMTGSNKIAKCQLKNMAQKMQTRDTTNHRS